MPGQRSGFLCDSFHQVAVAANRVRIVVDDVVPRPVVAGGQPGFRDRHANAITEALSERSRGYFHAGGMSSLRVSGRLAAPLSEMLDLLHRKIVAGQVQ